MDDVDVDYTSFYTRNDEDENLALDDDTFSEEGSRLDFCSIDLFANKPNGVVQSNTLLIYS